MSAPVVAIHRLPTEVEARVKRACLRAGAQPIATDAVDGESPALVVAHLPRRARRVPADALDAASRLGASLPLLLACDEALVHPATTLRLGGVTLVEHAANDRLYSQIRIALAAARGRARGQALDDAMEDAGAHWWLAAVRGDAVSGVARDEAVTALVPLLPGIDRAGMLAAAHETVTSGRGDLSSALVACLGSRAGLVHLSREARAWSLYWPPGAGALWLFSSHRLPHLSELSRASDAPRILHSPAQPGEIVLAASRAFAPSEMHVVHGLADGGPAALDRLRALAPPLEGFVMEVR